MVYDIVGEYPFLGSFFYGHWETFELNFTGFLLLAGSMLALLLLLFLGGAVGYVLQSIALCKIAKQQGAWRRIRVMACLPFARYFTVGKIAERCDAVLGKEKRRLWGRLMCICCCVLIPLTAVVLILAAIGLPGLQLVVMISECGNDILSGAGSPVIETLLTVCFVLVVLPVFLIDLLSSETCLLLLIVMPILAIVCFVAGTVCLGVLRTLYGICYHKVLRMYYTQKTATVLSVVCAVTGLFPFALFVASRRNP